MIKFKTDKKKERLPIGESKLFGNPHIFEGFEWPWVLDGEENYDMAFIAQLDCAELSSLGEKCPKYGMLYFFYDLDGLPENGGGRVIYYDGYLFDLHEMSLTDETGADISLPELKMTFKGGEHELFREDGERTVILSLSELENDEIKISFSGKRLEFSIDCESLRARKFENTNVKLV